LGIPPEFWFVSTYVFDRSVRTVRAEPERASARMSDSSS